MLTIISAMEEELAGVRRALEVGGNIPAATALHMVGIGRDAIERSLKGLLPALRQARDGDESPSGLLLLGFAGAVDPSLSTGDLVLAGRYCHLRELPVPLVRVPDGMTLEEFERPRDGRVDGKGPEPSPTGRPEVPGPRPWDVATRQGLLGPGRPDGN